jgi:hypothetical protein
MRINVVLVGLMLLFAFPLTRAEAVDPHQVGIVPSTPEMHDKSKEASCDCCQKCKAARRPLLPKEEEGPIESNGCQDCCEQCGKTVLPAPAEIPPEIDKRVPADIMDMPK